MTPRVPVAVYRLQFHAGFRFDDARRLVPYLHALGISDLYASPLLKARAGSPHGYDVTDVSLLNPELGSEADFRALAAELRRHDMGLLLDIVPNHMAAHYDNPWWRSVLEYGQASPHAAAFDIDWSAEPSGKLLVPTLGAPYGTVLENGELRLGLDDQGFTLQYHEQRFPVCPWTYRSILSLAARRQHAIEGPMPPFMDALRKLVQSADMHALHMISPDEAHRYGEELKKNLRELRRRDPALEHFLQASLPAYGGRTPDADAIRRLDTLLSQQPYRLAHWRIAADAVNYRRFFDINDLAGIRVEDEAVFDRSHHKILALAREGLITGLRVDHIDGLYDPQAYLERLQRKLAPVSPFYVVVEKILGPDETIPRGWPVAGTTGYDFGSVMNGMFVNPRGLHYLDHQYAAFTGDHAPFSERVTQAKEHVIRQLFPGELDRLTAWLGRFAADDRNARDIPHRELGQALIQVTASLSVYRTYTNGPSVSATDRAILAQALQMARGRTPEGLAGRASFAFLEQLLLTEHPAGDALSFIRRWQQFSGPVMAKGLEDTAFFRHTRLISLNAVGGLAEEVEQPADVKIFHAHQQQQRASWPHTLLTISTHDTKRSADVSARINVVSELPFAWARAFRKWRRLTKPFRRIVGNTSVPSPDEEILLYQTLLGSWPWEHDGREAYRERMQAFVRKAAREAKVNTDWIHPDEAYETALTGFTGDILDESKAADFLADFMTLQNRIAFLGGLNGLSQSLLLATSPGVPDVYQGTEMWDFSLTDPDNRRPVDFALRARVLAGMAPAGEHLDARELADLLFHWRDGRVKLYTLSRALQWRARYPELFRDGAYTPVYAAGVRQRNVCAFLRNAGDQWSLTAVPRQIYEIMKRGRFPHSHQSWRGTFLTLPPEAPDRWTNILTGESWKLRTARSGERQFPLHNLFRRFPVALLVSPG